ncbi:Mpo1-like protein [Thalassotalea fonticola]|uniref:Mpo1-like protein n=1 Tax=Thalassotalea fonticola TaxID=3065649 RepID=A0ABZ0GQ74_9GAMM|nr:Mpo1-like protein [Colwelliaceae bacterium S1-1]
MKNVVEQLSQYKSVHFNKKNIKTHFVGIPLIILSLTIFLSFINFQFGEIDSPLHVTAAMIFYSFVIIYYFILHWRLALGMVVYIIPNVYVASVIAPIEGALWIAIAIFVIGWIIQFIGHYYEKAKPAFVDDLSQFLIGPFFLMAEVYFGLGWEKNLLAEITPLARDKRRALEAKSRGE